MSRKEKGVVAAGHQVTAEAAAEILADGGTAFDALVAGLLTSCVSEVVFSSLGGAGVLMAFRAQDQQTLLYDFFAQTPQRKRPVEDLDFQSVDVDFGPATQKFHIGAGATATPGFVPGLFAIYEDLCCLPFSRLIEPAVRAARGGVLINKFQAYLFTVVRPILTTHERPRDYFMPRGHLLEEGDLYQNPEMAMTFEALAEEGLRLFTQGEVAQAIRAQAEDLGGHLSLDDLHAYQVIRRRPLMWSYHNHQLALNPAPAASGPLIAFGLGLLEKRSKGKGAPTVIDLASVMSETNRIRLDWERDRGQASPLTETLSKESIAEEIQRALSHPPAYRGTTHISVIDSDGNAASATVSNGEGNGHIVGTSGMMLNNMLGEEDLSSKDFHLWPLNKRLSTMMAPTLIYGQSGSLSALGSGGSNRIRTALLQVAVNLIDHKLSIEEAVMAPRIHLERGGTLSFEDFFSAEESTLLRDFSTPHAWPERNLFFGGVHIAHAPADGALEGFADPRRQGAFLIVDEPTI